MTARILQEDQSLLLTEATEPLINENFIGADGFITGSPVISTSSISQVHVLSPVDLVSGTPQVSSGSLAQVHILGPVDLVSGTPQVSSGSLAQVHAFSPQGLLTDAPQVSESTVTQVHDLTAENLASGTPQVSSSGLTQAHSLSSESIETAPSVSEASIIQAHDLGAEGFVTGSPSVPVVSIVEDEVLAPISIVVGSPTVSSPEIAQNHSISPESFTTRRPDIGTTADPAWLVDDIQEIEQMFGGWPRRNYEVPDGRLVQAEREIERTFNQKVSVDKKAKSLIKFGKSASLPTGSLQTVWTVGGNETYVQDNLIDTMSSSSALDSQEVFIEGHTVTGTGTNQQFTFVTQVATLDGQNKVLLDTPLARISHAYNNNGTNILGRVVFYQDTPIVGGIPTDTTKIHLDIPAALQGAFKGATTFSNSDYFILTGGFGSVSLKQAGSADFYLEIREPGKVFRQVAAVSASSGAPWDIDLDPAVIVPKNCDVRVRVEAGANNMVVFCVFKGYLAKVL